MSKNYLGIVAHYESCLERFGDTPRGVDWPTKKEADASYRVMLDVVRPGRRPPARLLDFGCGTAQMYDYVLENQITGIEYSGLDLSERFLDVARRKHPGIPFFHQDVLEEGASLPEFHYIVLNGVLTEKLHLSFEEMFSYAQRLLKRVFRFATVGIAFNVMSKEVDWERDDLFHLPFDALASFLTRELSRNYVFRHDYGFYKYTAYVYR